MARYIGSRVLKKEEYSEEQAKRHRFIRDFVSPTFRIAFPEISAIQHRITKRDTCYTEAVVITFKFTAINNFQKGEPKQATKTVYITDENYKQILSTLLKNLIY